MSPERLRQFCCWLLATLPLLVFAQGALSSEAATAIPDYAAPVTSRNDDRAYRYTELDNGLRVLLISDPSADKAAAALDVDAGSADNPEDRPGLAHFLEHMLFLGTAKYPEADEYQSFISAHGGGHNAYTSDEHTNYFFYVDHRYLEPALDRFSQFFIAPLFTEQYVERERNAVNSEYTAKIKNSYRREMDVWRELVNPRHPASKFSVGSLETLADREDDLVRDDLLQFYEDYYSADRMTLVVLGRESLEQLQGLVQAHFAAVPKRKVRSHERDVPLFGSNTLPLRVQIKPVKEERRLTLAFPVPPTQRYYREKPLQYIGSIVGHEGQGSLLSLLKQMGWAEALSAGGGYGSRDQTTFNITISLTPEGYRQQDKVVAATFRMLQKIRESGVEEWRFGELQSLADMEFRFLEKSEPIDTVSRLANSMHDYPLKDIVRGPYRYDKYDAWLIKRYLKYLRPDNLLWVVTAPEVETDKVSQYYQTNYAVESLKREATVMAKADLDKLQLPQPNQFIPKRLQVKSPPAIGRSSALPESILRTDALDVWFQQDTNYNVPKAEVRIRALLPRVGGSARSAALTHLYAALVNDSLNEFAYPASLAGLYFSVRATGRGLDLSLSGYNDRQGLLLNRILGVVDRNRFDSDRFNSIRRELVRSWRNQTSAPPYDQLLRKLPVLTYSPYWDQLDMADELESVTPLELRRFSEKLWQGSQLKMLFYGNLYRQEAQQLASLVGHRLHTALDEEDKPVLVKHSSVAKLPDTPSRYHLQVDHNDTAVVLYQQALGDSVRDRANMSMLQQLQRAPFFHQLRTEQQLGYIVFVSAMGFKDVAGSLWVVQSPSAPVADVVEAMVAFAGQPPLRDGEFEKQRQALLTGLLETPQNLAEQAERYWSEIVMDARQFDRRQQLIEEVRGLTPEGVAVYARRLQQSGHRLWLTADSGADAPAPQVPVADLNRFKTTLQSYKYP
ncbi:insulinase family protein [Pseudomaricurvus sp. HS19]|uniref:insulinase family protein n=1 Tax=Pseudomaricurvus sp. HS19 TaxID=2692626 RepID=UPI001371F3FD|nr:insulinase family protein [Pseudomaricurvus sp. HS19]MYM65043.1 peptidase M16 [Pseudomaricurvus sp. HS19]